jgi:hypothetical protein
MEDGINNDRISGRLVEYLKWKAANRRMPKLVDCYRKGARMTLNRKQTRLHAPQKVLAESRFALLVTKFPFHASDISDEDRF